MKYLNLSLILFLLIGFNTACSESENENREQDIQQAENASREDFEQSISALEAQGDRPAILARKEQAHLDYGIYLIYNTEPENMRENANDALRQFIEVLKINPDNEKAASEIEQILSIYRTFPDREPEEDVKEDLQELGFEI